jgi:hypothetical protein
MFFADPERRIANRARQFQFWYVRRVLFWFGVHNWTELRREKAAFCEICSLLDSNAGLVNGPR